MEVTSADAVSAGVSGRRQGAVSDDGDSTHMNNLESSAKLAGNHSEILGKNFRAAARPVRETAFSGRRRGR